ncbi:MAG: SDR family oxidoreductase [Saprospiraceae bacterium]|nr:SDR family oxidoreductase [Lewinella sp.]
MEKIRVLITGATKGIGRAIAGRFAQEGARLAVTARTEADVRALQEDLEKKYPGTEVLPIAADVGNAGDISNLADTIEGQWGRLDVLVNNAGLFIQDDLLMEPESNLDRSLQVNLYGPYRLCRELLPMMLAAGKGHIINICSVASKIAFPNSGSYVISKHALLGLTRALRLELREKGIKVTAMMPGATWTSSWEGADIDPGRLMQPEDVAEAVFAVWKMGPSTVVEEMQLRPQLGDV